MYEYMYVHAQLLRRIQLLVTPCRSLDSSDHGIFPGKSTGVGCHFLSGDLPYPGVESESPMFLALTGRFFTTEPPGK